MNYPTQDIEIINLILSNDDTGRRSIVIQDIRVKFQRIARYKRIPENDIEDVVSDGIEKLLKKLPKFHGRAPFNHWVTVLFGNHCIDYFRRCSREKRIFENSTFSDCNSDTNTSYFDFLAADISSPDDVAHDQRRLDLIVAILDKVIERTSSLRRNTDRDALIANLGLKELLEPIEIHSKLLDQYPGLSMNAIRIVLHEFRAALRKELKDDDD